MKKLLLLPFIMLSCSKGNEATPTPPPAAPAKTINHKLLILDNTNLTSNLYINGVRRDSITDTIIVKSGDKIQVVNVGNDTWVGSVKTDSYLSVQIYLDNEVIFNVSCYCDVLFNKTID
jgi:hypothetical protein